MKVWNLSLIAAVMALFVAGCNPESGAEGMDPDTTGDSLTMDSPEMGDDAAAGPDIVDVAVGAGDFNTLVSLVQAAGLEETLRSGEFTVFAPTDEAFAAVDPAILQALSENTDALRQVLLYHVVEGRVPASEVVNMSAAATAGGEDVAIAVDGETVSVNGATVVTADIEASNGIIHVINQVLIPSNLEL